ncbi:MAG: ABC transporter ATP-binding protein [Kiritimatiellia bacterium]|nr:ABC transporter ATP-binding protein [Kiritimatiellia bacterium]
MTADILSASALAKTYRIGPSAVPVLQCVSFRVRPGETVAIVGASGAGKSTLLNVLGGLDRPTSGTVRIDGSDVYGLSELERTRLRAERIGFVFQSYHLVSELNVLENVQLAALSGWGSFRNRSQLKERASGLLDRVGLGARLLHRPDELSGGEQQRVAIARALMNDPDLVLADEPTGNLDVATGEKILDSLFAVAGDRKRSVILVTHNPDLADRCHRKLELRNGLLDDSPA